ncbi:hypothetical protein QFZ79_000126 [Arthrobacter sp. V4I6]|uniref:hypothetical protein n=1 Tax=unclassified Arthrobacter TaxID=235627 RepID=UPI0027841258|nr:MULTISPECIES: hypothetical protein [unclassified Arthrobacter]MDQ0822389.1 hypothetical protein [Arthrobacter sp. V1I7]MDQ0852015.1 hypothetical protein [Arthrobacter sp. V4I6]
MAAAARGLGHARDRVAAAGPGVHAAAGYRGTGDAPSAWKNEVFGPNDGGTWRVEPGNLLICERGADFFVAVAMGTEPMQLPVGSVQLSAPPLAEDGWLQPNNAVWVLRD